VEEVRPTRSAVNPSMDLDRVHLERYKAEQRERYNRIQQQRAQQDQSTRDSTEDPKDAEDAPLLG
jgi:hypothetical protein